MKRNQQYGKQLKAFPFQFTPLMLTLFISALALSVVGFGLTAWRFTHFLKDDGVSAYGWMQHLILFAVSILLAVIIISMLIRSQYIVTEKAIILQFGIIKTTYPIKDVFSLHLFKDTGKLTVYFDDFHSKYTVIVVNEEWYLDFVQTICDVKPSVEFSFSSAEDKKE